MYDLNTNLEWLSILGFAVNLAQCCQLYKFPSPLTQAYIAIGLSPHQPPSAAIEERGHVHEKAKLT